MILPLDSQGADIDTITEYCRYNPETGDFFRLFDGVKRGKRWRIRKGTSVTLNYYRHEISRLAFVLQLGRWPHGLVDHKNGNPRDFKWDNLREATPQQSNYNSVTFGKHKKGVYFNKTVPNRPWQASIVENNKRTRIGFFKTEDAAHAAYKKRADRVQKEFALHNSREEEL